MIGLEICGDVLGEEKSITNDCQGGLSHLCYSSNLLMAPSQFGIILSDEKWAEFLDMGQKVFMGVSD